MTVSQSLSRMSSFLALVVLFVVSHASAQSPPLSGDSSAGSVVQVETLELEPTVVKTGDIITQTYRVRFPDLIGEGKEIIILEDRMTPENLPVHPFEGVSLDIDKRQVGDEHVWDFEYGLRLVSPEKAVYVIPGFSFYYLTRDLGEDIEDAEVEQVDAGGGLVRYVTTLTDVPVIDVRDTIELGSFGTQSIAFRALAWGLAPLPFVIWLVFLVRHIRRPREVNEDEQREADELEEIESRIPVPPSLWQARRILLGRVRAIDDLLPGETSSSLHDVQRDLVIAGREFLQAELPSLHSGDTPKEICRRIEALKDGGRKNALMTLAQRLVAYQTGLERGEPVPIEDPVDESNQLTMSISRLRPHNRLIMRVKDTLGFSQN